MTFTSISFLYYFLPIFLIFYFLIPNKFKNLILLLFSFIFYFYAEPKYILLIILEILVAYFFGIIIEKKKKKSILIFAIIFHVLILCIFKYSNFIINNINIIFDTNIKFLNILLPIGISFYTFQIISYEIDVYKNQVKAQKNLLLFATYVFLFPQLIAGPIVRYETIKTELNSRKHSFKNLSDGTTRFIIGLSKKVLIANNLGELCNIFITTQEKSIVFYWIFSISYMLQLYFDFSGYSDIAIGLGRVLGFNFPENFNYPYISKSTTEFWKRWHISLSSWFKDYIYIPLGGNKHGKLNQVKNILIVWILTGLWHGASWNFIMWGFFFGIILIVEKFIFSNILKKVPNFIKHLYTLFTVMISFVIFQANDLKEALYNIKGLFGLNKDAFINSYTIYNLKGYFIILIISIIGATPLLKKFITLLKSKNSFNKVINLLQPIYLLVLLFLVTMFLIDNSYNPFLYFRF